MALANTFIEDLRLELQNELQTLLTYNPGGGPVTEATVVNEFADVAEQYPQVVIDVETSSSPSRHIGTRDKFLVKVVISIMAIRPTSNAHITICEDTKKRSARGLVEYLAIKIDQFLETFSPSFNIIDSGHDLTLNLDYEEREDVFKSQVDYDILV